MFCDRDGSGLPAERAGPGAGDFIHKNVIALAGLPPGPQKVPIERSDPEPAIVTSHTARRAHLTGWFTGLFGNAEAAKIAGLTWRGSSCHVYRQSRR